MIRYNIYRNIVISIFIILFLFTINGYFGIREHKKYYSIDVKYMTEQRVGKIVNKINYLPRTAGNDVLFLSKLSSLKRYLNNENSKNLIFLQNDFFEFSKENEVYAQLRYIDENGDEKVRIDFNETDHIIIKENKLQNKFNRFYFQEALKISKGDVYISRLDLNVENDVIENIGTKDKPIYVPMLRYVTPVFNDKKFRGAVVSNIYAKYFLEEIRRMQQDNESVFLIDNKGDYLVNKNKSKEFGFMFNSKNNFVLDYPEIYNFLIKNPDEKIYETSDFIVFIEHIYPTLGSFEVYQTSEKIFGKELEEHYHWILIDILPKKYI